ncbi:hypothetical protein EGT07_16410 [Herbaspirillum sp. HC18]|nr:hypothetical protein EGT07_16410 [Herbaspirillum sp. HC18]
MQSRSLIFLAMLGTTLLASCASNSPASVMTTQGSTLVQSGRIKDIRDVTVHGGSKSAELIVQFDNGDVRDYRIDHEETFRVGDRITVTTSQGVSKVRHQ